MSGCNAECKKFYAVWARACAAFVLCVWVPLCNGCGRAKARPNVILVTLDTTRADRLGCYGYEQALTPTLNEMAAQGVLFESAFTCVPLTLPSHASMLSGLLPPEHGIHVNGQSSLSPTVETIAEKLLEKGYQNGAFLASVVLHSRYGLAQGFSVYDDDWIGDGSSGGGIRRQREGEQVVDSALAWLASCGKTNPFFCWVHLFDPHTPYLPHRDLFGDRFLENPYDGEIAYVDRQMARLVEFVKNANLKNETWIIVAGDHGEGLGEHDELEHGTLVYNSTLHVPLIFCRVGANMDVPAVQTPVSLVDIYPTILALCGCPPTPRSFAADLTPALSGGPVAPRQLYGETDNPLLTYGWCPLRVLIDSEWKYIRGADSELYDISTDAGETDNQAAQQPERVAMMESVLAGMESEMVLVKPDEAQMTESDRQVLASLGYSAGSGAAADIEDVTSLPSPRAMMPVLLDVTRSYRLLRQGKQQEAINILRKAVEQDPGNLSFQFDLGKALYRAGQTGEAAHLLQQAVQDPPAWVDADLLIRVFTLYAAVLARQGNLEEAIHAGRTALELDRQSIRALNSLAWILATHADNKTYADEAVRLSQQALDLGGAYDASNLDTHAAALANAGAYQQAVKMAAQAIELARLEKNPALANDIEKRQQLYAGEKPYRAP
ncbi:MAG: tetratricopeptide repeat protein [Spartobacteria bacterium]|nr:tetratricopeptide repeat protein [Spartobacteria bacterium]